MIYGSMELDEFDTTDGASTSTVEVSGTKSQGVNPETGLHENVIDLDCFERCSKGNANSELTSESNSFAEASGGFTLRRRSSNSNISSAMDIFPTNRNTAGGSPLSHLVHSRSRAVRDRESLCTSPVTALVGSTLKQMNLKRSSSAPMINQLGISKDNAGPQTFGGLESQLCQKPATSVIVSNTTTATRPTSIVINTNPLPSGSGGSRDVPMEIDASSFATSFLASLNHPRPRRFSASFSPGSPGPAPNRVHQLRNESTTDWETASEKEFIGTMSIAQSWEDLSLESMSMDMPLRRTSVSEQLYLSINPVTSSASSSPAASPRILSARFSPVHSSPSPTRKSFTTRRSLSPIAVRPSVLTVGLASGIGLKRKSDWDSSSNSNQMDCSPQPPAAKRVSGLLSWSQQSPYSGTSSGMSSPIPSPSPLVNHQLVQCQLATHEESPNSFDTGSSSSISCVGESDSPFFRPVDSPLNSPSDVSSADTSSSHKT